MCFSGKRKEKKRRKKLRDDILQKSPASFLESYEMGRVLFCFFSYWLLLFLKDQLSLIVLLLSSRNDLLWLTEWFIFLTKRFFFFQKKTLLLHCLPDTENKYSFKNQKSALFFNLVCKTAFKSMNFAWVEHFRFSQRERVTLCHLVHYYFPPPSIICISATPLSHWWSLNLLRRICSDAALKKPQSILPVSLSHAVMTHYNVPYLPINTPKTLPNYITLCFHSDQFSQHWGGGGMTPIYLTSNAAALVIRG